jgi:RimJ/RimL family protein N-acetyltransferase
MLHEITKENYAKVRPLFKGLSFQPFCTAVLAGIQPGRVFADDPEQPQAAFVNMKKVWCFLAGDPNNKAFNQALNEAILERRAIDQDTPAMLFTCHPGDWGGQLVTVSAPHQPMPFRRRRYACRRLTYDWQAHIPQGFSVHHLDEGLLNRPGLKVPEEVTKIVEEWHAITDARFNDFGFVAIHDASAEIASWATVDCIIDGVGDAGLFTVEGYRQRGLATVTTAAAVDHGLSNGLSAVRWTCTEDNAGSIRTAEKLGFERGDDYTMYYFAFD